MKQAKLARLEVRVTARQKQLIERAASLRGSSVTDFVASCTQQAALQAIRESQSIRLSDEASLEFAKVMLNPPQPNEAARRAVARYRQLVVKSE